MKTIEEKAKAYDEAVKRARSLVRSKEIDIADMNFMFPELAESEDEDERIRKETISIVQSYMNICDEDGDPCLSGYKVLNWLEKQKEEKHATIEQVYEKFLSSDTLKLAKENKYIRAQVLWELMHNGIITEVDYQYLTDDKRKPWTTEEYRIAYQKGFETSEQLKQKEQKPVINDEQQECPYKDLVLVKNFFGEYKRKCQLSNKACDSKKCKQWNELQSEFKNINEAFEDGKNEVIANPEKYGLQKEQKLERINITEMVAKYRATDEYVEGDYKGKPVNCMIRAYEQGIRDTLSKVKEQKPSDYCSVRDEFDLDGNLKRSPAWSEEDVLSLDRIIGSLNSLKQYVRENTAMSQEYKEAVFKRIEQEYSFLKSLPERFNLQPKQEWSEENKNILADTIFKLAGFMGNEKNIDFLKSLRPSWKPTQEQMNELWSAISYIELPGSNYLGVPELLESIYEQLKKL